MDPKKTGRDAAHRLSRLLRDVDFPTTRRHLVEKIQGRTFQVTDEYAFEPAEVLARSAQTEFMTPADVARTLVAEGVIRARPPSDAEAGSTPSRADEGERSPR